MDVIVEARRYYPSALPELPVGYIGKMDPGNGPPLEGQELFHRLRSARRGSSNVQELKGKDGGIYLEVDSMGRLNRVLESRKWVPGADIFLTIDSKAQAAAEEGLQKSISGKGAVVALDPRTGAVLAFVSMPDYDPNMFVLSGSEKEGLPAGKILPEFNVALQGSYPPGSIFKIITAAAILESGRVSPDEKFRCPGWYDAGSRIFKCWEKRGHGNVAFIEGLAKSCDVYFYMASQRAGALAIEQSGPSGWDRLPRYGCPARIVRNIFGPQPPGRQEKATGSSAIL